jgi:endonuclease VIII
MPEGDTIFRAAQTLHRALAGRIVTEFESMIPALTRVNVDTPLVGRTIQSVTARGKHSLMAFSGDLVLRTHMRMNGSWHIYRPGERWQRPARDMRVLVGTAAFVAVGFNVPDAELLTIGFNVSDAELLTTSALDRHRQLQRLGPDLLDPAFDRAEALRRMREHDREAIADVLLNQRVMAGIGNVFKCEILFMAGVHPFAATGTLSLDTLERIIDISLTQLGVNVVSRSRTLAPAFGRRTTGSLHPAKGMWVYARAGEPCRKCGEVVRLSKTGVDARLTYWCPHCQAT